MQLKYGMVEKQLSINIERSRNMSCLGFVIVEEQKVPSTVIVKLNVDFENREKKKVVRI